MYACYIVGDATNGTLMDEYKKCLQHFCCENSQKMNWWGEGRSSRWKDNIKKKIKLSLCFF
jgi:hypothetical protein